MLVDEKIIIRTFLFLTNDGTPDGKKLSELTRLQLLDKQYLGIDTLAGFMKFWIAKDEALSALFTEAGCESLLDLHVLERFQVSELTAKDPLYLLKYLRGINNAYHCATYRILNSPWLPFLGKGTRQITHLCSIKTNPAMDQNTTTRPLTTNKAQKILAEDGLEVPENQAESILDFLRILANIVVRDYLTNHEESRSIRTRQHG